MQQDTLEYEEEHYVPSVVCQKEVQSNGALVSHVKMHCICSCETFVAGCYSLDSDLYIGIWVVGATVHGSTGSFAALDDSSAASALAVCKPPYSDTYTSISMGIGHSLAGDGDETTSIVIVMGSRGNLSKWVIGEALDSIRLVSVCDLRNNKAIRSLLVSGDATGRMYVAVRYDSASSGSVDVFADVTTDPHAELAFVSKLSLNRDSVRSALSSCASYSARSACCGMKFLSAASASVGTTNSSLCLDMVVDMVPSAAGGRGGGDVLLVAYGTGLVVAWDYFASEVSYHVDGRAAAGGTDQTGRNAACETTCFGVGTVSGLEISARALVCLVNSAGRAFVYERTGGSGDRTGGRGAAFRQTHMVDLNKALASSIGGSPSKVGSYGDPTLVGSSVAAGGLFGCGDKLGHVLCVSVHAVPAGEKELTLAVVVTSARVLVFRYPGSWGLMYSDPLQGRGHHNCGTAEASVSVTAAEACIQSVTHEAGGVESEASECVSVRVTVAYVSAFDRKLYQKQLACSVCVSVSGAATTPNMTKPTPRLSRAVESSSIGNPRKTGLTLDQTFGSGSEGADSAGEDTGPFSFFPRVGRAVPEDSPLHRRLEPPPTDAAYKGAAAAGGVVGGGARGKQGRGAWEAPVFSKGRPVDQPVTFHTKVKSSGYGAANSDHDLWLAKQRKIEKQKKLAAKGKAGVRENRTMHAIGAAPSATLRLRTNSAPSKPKLAPAVGRVTLADQAAADPDEYLGGMQTTGTGTGAAGGGAGVRIRQYPTACKLLCDHQPYNDLAPPALGGAAQPRPVTRIQFNHDGSLLGLVYNDNSFSTARLPVSKYAGQGDGGVHYCGHADGSQVTSIHFSSSGSCAGPATAASSTGAGASLILSSGTDGTVRIWRQGRTEAPGVIISHTRHNVDPAAGSGTGSNSASASAISLSRTKGRNKPLMCEIPCARFYYSDQFVAVAHKSVLRMYAYEFPGAGNSSSNSSSSKDKGGLSKATQSNNELKRIYNQLSSAGVYKCVHAFDHSTVMSPGQSGGATSTGSSTRITAFNCINTVQSPMILTATADRKIHLLDVGVGKVAYTIGGNDGSCFPHDRAVHCLALPPGPSIHTSGGVPISQYTVFASTAVDNLIALYDIRTPQYCVARYSGHRNTRDPIQIAFSPCLRYVSTGSEDRSVRILDIRGGFTELAKIHHIHKDTVSDVAYNPLFPQMSSCSYDGTVKFYC